MRQKLPEWVKRGIVDTEKTRLVRNILRDGKLNTVCDSARCPNKGECYSKNTATFLILGNTCTRSCRFCSVNSGIPETVNPLEPEAIAKAVKKLQLDYVVITSVTRDDLKDGGSSHFAKTIRSIKNVDNNIKVEILTPDFLNEISSIENAINAKPDVFNHNIETVKRLYPIVRPQANYKGSLDFISCIKSKNPDIITKSGIMVGLGEEPHEITETLIDLKNHNCDIVTIGQYIQPTRNHLEVKKYYTPEEFELLKLAALEIGIKYPISAPLVRSSYKAKEAIESIKQ